MAGVAAPAISAPALAAQTTFRAVMDAFARPGTVRELKHVPSAPAPLQPASAAVALALVDQDTPLWLDAGLAAAPEIADWLRFYTGAPLVTAAERAAFAIVSDPMTLPALEAFDLGTPDYPDRSTTVVLQVESLTEGAPIVLTGPGIARRNCLRASPLPDDMAERLAANRTLFPCGVDLLLVAGSAVAALPRSVRIERD